MPLATKSTALQERFYLAPIFRRNVHLFDKKLKHGPRPDMRFSNKIPISSFHILYLFIYLHVKCTCVIPRLSLMNNQTAAHTPRFTYLNVQVKRRTCTFWFSKKALSSALTSMIMKALALFASSSLDMVCCTSRVHFYGL